MVYCARLESGYTARYRGFESPPLRQIIFSQIMDYNEQSLRAHRQTKGKIGVTSKFPPLTSKDDLSVAYTPGVAAVSALLAKEPAEAYDYSIKGNTIAVISDGSAVLGLGNIGPYGALPVMEGKALLFKEFADVDAYPLVLNTQDSQEIIKIITALAPTFGGINLEDISAPRCFEIEEALIKNLDIPVFHDDQHGTAIVILAALINALKLADKKIEEIKIVVVGAGAAGIATTKLLLNYGVKNIIVVDSTGAICSRRTDLNNIKQDLLSAVNPQDICGDLATALKDADVFIGVSQPGLLTAEMIKTMADRPIIFAMANPTPEIMPDVAKAGGAYIVGTGRSDFANQINNVLVFPGLFRGLLDAKIKMISTELKIAVAKALADYLPSDQLSPDKILPSVLDKNVAKAVAQAVLNFNQ